MSSTISLASISFFCAKPKYKQQDNKLLFRYICLAANKFSKTLKPLNNSMF